MPFTFVDIQHDGAMGIVNNITVTSDLEGADNARLSGVFTHQKRLWLDKHGDAKIWYSLQEAEASMEQELRSVLGAVLLTADKWTKETDGCIQFIRLPFDTCSKADTLDHGVVHINTYEAKCCSTYFGYRYGEEGGENKCQEMCIDSRGCTHIEMKKLVSNTLGLLSPINRPDRDDYIAFHPELLSEKLWPPLSFNAKPRWLSLQKCDSSLVSTAVPVPYDYLSNMHPVTSEYADSMGDPKGIVVTQDGAKQYLLDHRHVACPELSHLDLYQVHKTYGCEKKFIQDCKDTPPKCMNYGYLKKDCTCACSRNFGGARCEQRLSNATDFCYDNVWFLNINDTGLYNTTDVGMYLSTRSPVTSDSHLVKLIQFLTVSVQLLEIGKHVSVALNHTAMQTIMTKMQPKLDYFIENINMTECDAHEGGSVLYWGASLSNHIRSWCFSSLLLNEASPTILRSRVPNVLHLAFRSSLGMLTSDAQLSLDVLQMQLEVTSFGVMNHTKHKSGDAQEGGGRSSGGGGGTRTVAEALMEAGAGGIIGAVIMGVLLLAGIGALAAWMWSRADDDDGSDYSDYSSSEGSEPEDAASAIGDAEQAAAEEDAEADVDGELAEEAASAPPETAATPEPPT